MYVHTGRPAFARPYVGVHESTSLMSSSLLLQQCPVSSTEKDMDTRLTKAWTAINRLSIILKSDLTDKMKRGFFQAAVASILLYGCTTWTLTKWLEKKLEGNYTRMLRAILNKSWWQNPTRHQLYGHLPPITKTIQVRRTRHSAIDPTICDPNLFLNYNWKEHDHFLILLENSTDESSKRTLSSERLIGIDLKLHALPN